MADHVRITVWNEFRHERDPAHPEIGRLYPDGIHGTIAGALTERLGDAVSVGTATLDEPRHGLSDETLAETDVLVWWGHMAHDQVDDEVANAVVQRVLDGMGLVTLHSAMHSKPFVRLMGTSCNLRWRENNDRQALWVVSPSHPIVRGLPPVVLIPADEMYGEYFDIPPPEELVFISAFTGGEVFRSGCCFRRGFGKIFYFSPGHETYPVYHQPEVQQILANGVMWAYGTGQPAVERRTAPRSPAGWWGSLHEDEVG
ncbi:MAG: ThuA domain-containing protein [Gaiellales bacterium]